MKNMNLKLYLFLAAFFMLPNFAYAIPTANPPKPVFFEEGWQDTPDWSSGITQHDWPISFAADQGGTCSTSCPPSGWTGFANEATTISPLNIANNVNCSDPSVINQEKCLIYSVVTEGDYGAWHGARMGKLFPKVEGYHEMYVRMKVKFGPV